MKGRAAGAATRGAFREKPTQPPEEPPAKGQGGRRGRWGDGREGGAATVEFVFAGVLLLAPLLYLVVALSEAQRNAFAVTQAAREAGRAYVTADDPATAPARAGYAVRLALADQHLAGDAELRWGPVGHGCDGTPLAGDSLTVDSTVSPVSTDVPPLTPGSRFEFCVRRTYRLPGVPTLFDGGRNVVEARFVVRVDDLRGER